ncbi:MAG: universal stress protein [Halofilum sp. (in: g-proteobacteria)]
MINNILAPIDGSEHANRAVKLAADLAAKYGARLHLFHVLLEGGVPERLLKLSTKTPEQLQPQTRWMVTDYDGWMAKGYHEMLTMATSNSQPREILEDIADKLLTQAREEAQAQGVEKVDLAHAAGSPAPQILNRAREVEADTIVMGCRGLAPIPELAVGSVTHKVQRVFPGTVITVR